jgi:hypothetical protein
MATEKIADLDSKELKVILILSGMIREISEGKYFEQAIYDTASQIDKLYNQEE